MYSDTQMYEMGVYQSSNPNPILIANGTNNANWQATNGTRIFIADTNSNAIVEIVGGVAIPRIASSGQNGVMALSATSLYLSQASNIEEYSLTDFSKTATFGTGAASSFGMCVLPDSSYLYVTDGNTLTKYKLSDKTSTAIITDTTSSCAASSSFVYVSIAGGTPRVVKVDTSTNAVTTISGFTSAGGKLAISPSYKYVASWGSHATDILKTADDSVVNYVTTFAPYEVTFDTSDNFYTTGGSPYTAYTINNGTAIPFNFGSPWVAGIWVNGILYVVGHSNNQSAVLQVYV